MHENEYTLDYRLVPLFTNIVWILEIGCHD